MTLTFRLKWICILLCLCGFLFSQGVASFSAEHCDDHSSHCCDICHVGHSLVLAPANGLAFSPSFRVQWHRSAERPAFERTPLTAVSGSRAPPSA